MFFSIVRFEEDSNRFEVYQSGLSSGEMRQALIDYRSELLYDLNLDDDKIDSKINEFESRIYAMDDSEFHDMKFDLMNETIMVVVDNE